MRIFGEEEEARVYLEKILELEEWMGEYHGTRPLDAFLGKAYYYLEDYEKAEEHLSRVREGDELYFEAWELLDELEEREEE